MKRVLSAALALEWLVVFGLPALTPGHALLHDYVSTAGVDGQPYAVAIAVLGVVAAVLHAVVVVLLARAAAAWDRVALVTTVAFLLLVGAGFLVPCDPGCALQTTAAQVHHWLGTIGFTLLGLGALVVLATHWPWRTLAFTAIILGVMDLALLWSDTTGRWQGLTERLTIVAMQAWSVAWWRELAPRLQRQTLSPGSPG